MASKIINVKKQFVTNSIPDQHLTHANQLTIKSWNDIINILRLQTNNTTEYLENLHRWLIGDDSYGTVEIPADAKSYTQYILDLIQKSIDNTDVIDNLESNSATAALSANQGRILNEKLINIEGNMIKNLGTISDYNYLNSTLEVGYYIFSLYSESSGTTYLNIMEVESTNSYVLQTILKIGIDQPSIMKRKYTISSKTWTTSSDTFVMMVHIQDNLNSKSKQLPLSANQGRILNEKITNLENNSFNKDYNDLINKPTIPNDTIQLTNSAGFITNTVNNLTNYYLKTETYTKEEVVQLLSTVSSLSIKVVDSLPTINISTNSIYLVRKTITDDTNIYDEYIYINGNWEKIGDTQINLDGYAKVDDIPTKLSQLEIDVELGLTEEEILSIIEENLNTKTIITNTSKTTVTVGGITKGSTLNGLDVKTVIENIFFPYVAFSMGNMSTSPSASGVYEKGKSVTLNSVTVPITMGSKSLTNITLYDSDGTTVLAEKTSGITTSNTFSGLGKSISSKVTFKATATDGTTSLSKTISVYTFVDPYYYGAMDQGYTLTSDLIKSGTKQVVSKGNKTYSFTTNAQHPYIAYPSSYGNLTSILDGNNFENINSFTKHTMNITVASGLVSYNVYVQNNAPTLNRFSYTFKF